MTTKAVLGSVEGFDERYFFYLEETDLFHAIQGEGLHVAYLPDAHITHFGGLGADDVSFDKALMYRQSLMKYFQKNRPAWEANVLGWYWKITGKTW